MEEGEFLTLIQELMTPCQIMNYVRQDDPFGGYTKEWQPGATFNAAVIKNASTEAQVAEKQGMSELYTVVVDKGFELDFHDVFKRLSDGEIFRVTSRTKDSEAPERSTVKIAKVTAEKWELTT